MSVEYYIVCHKHKDKFWVCSDGYSGPVNQLTGNKRLAAFLITHRNCELKVIDEHDEECDNYRNADEIQWKLLIEYDKE